jgi:amino acid transporter
MPKKLHKIGVFVFAMMNVAIVLSLRGLPMIADTGTQMIFFILFASLLFLLPVSLVSAELATGWTKEGGVYRWIKEAFGSKLGFTAIWIQWIQNAIWNVTVLAFAAAALSYLFFDPKLATNPLFIVAVVFIVYWGAMFINFRGFKAASWFAKVCVRHYLDIRRKSYSISI